MTSGRLKIKVVTNHTTFRAKFATPARKAANRRPHEYDDGAKRQPRRAPRPGSRAGYRPRRAHRRRGPLGHWRGVSPARALPVGAFHHPRRARIHRRHVGLVPLSGHPIGLRHVHARLQLPAVAQQQGHLRRSDDSRLHPRHRTRVRHRQIHPLPP